MSGTVRTIVAVGLVLIALACIAGTFWLAQADHATPGELIALGGVAVGALARVMPSDRADPPPPASPTE